MSYIHSFTQVTPPARYDGVAWTAALAQEAASSEGPYTLRQTVTLPVDATPSTPNPVDITVTAATLPDGWFRFVFRDAGGNQSGPTLPVRSPGDNATLGFAVPSGEAVAALLHARTMDRDGNELGVFGDNTRPTGAQAAALAAQAAGDVAARIGYGLLADPLSGLATNVAAIRAAMLIELSYFPEQSAGDQSPYEQLRALYEQQLGFLSDAVAGDTSGTNNRLTQVPVRSLAYGTYPGYYG